MNNKMAYLGILDDFALRYKLPGACSEDTNNLNEILLTQAFIGPPLLINDGYFVNHPAMRNAIISPDLSPLTRLTESSFINILTRNDGRLDMLVEDMDEMGITTGKDLAQTNLYARKLKPSLESWMSVLNSPACNAFRKWPPFDMDESFFRTLKLGFDQFLNNLPKELMLVLSDLWDEFTKGDKKRRTEWENIAKDWLGRKSISDPIFKTLMSIGNQAYQYSWACVLTSHHSEISVRAETNASNLYIDLHESNQIDEGEPKRGVRFLLPDLNSDFAAKNIKGRWELVAEMLSVGHKVNIAKHEFMDRLDEYPKGLCKKEVLEDATKQYSDRLSTHFKMDMNWLPLTFDFTALIGTTALGSAIGVGSAIGGPVGTAVGFGIGLTGVGASHVWPGPKIYNWAFTPSKKGWFTELKSTVVDNSSSSLTIKAEKAKKHLKGIKEFKVNR